MDQRARSGSNSGSGQSQRLVGPMGGIDDHLRLAPLSGSLGHQQKPTKQGKRGHRLIHSYWRTITTVDTHTFRTVTPPPHPTVEYELPLFPVPMAALLLLPSSSDYFHSFTPTVHHPVVCLTLESTCRRRRTSSPFISHPKKSCRTVFQSVQVPYVTRSATFT